MENKDSQDEIIRSKYDLVVIEPTNTVVGAQDFDTASMVTKIKQSKASDGISNKIVLAYVNLGEAEDWREYWDNIKADNIVIGGDPDGWTGNYMVEYWNQKWKNIFLYGSDAFRGQKYKSLMDEIINDGFDGVYLEYASEFLDIACDYSRKQGYIPYCARRPLSQLNNIPTYK